VGEGGGAAPLPPGRAPVLSFLPMFGPPIPAITVEELKARRDRGEKVTLLDVREPNEWAISDLPDSIKMPLSSLPLRFGELPQKSEIVVYCRTGGRSGNAVQFLRQKGYEKAVNLAGGINRWAEMIDPTMSRY
jgi:rhodanese-related sulfurtransferase